MTNWQWANVLAAATEPEENSKVQGCGHNATGRSILIFKGSITQCMETCLAKNQLNPLCNFDTCTSVRQRT